VPWNAAGGLEADRIEAGGDEKIPDFRRLTQVELVVRRKALRPAEKTSPAYVLQHGHALHGSLEHRHELVLHVPRQLVEAEVLGDPIHAPGAGIILECADKNAARVLAVIGALVVVPHHRQVRWQIVELFGVCVVVLAGVQGYVDAR
jgi:hypothetical protein